MQEGENKVCKERKKGLRELNTSFECSGGRDKG